MDDSAAMRFFESLANFNAIHKTCSRGNGAFAKTVGEGLAFEIFHHQVRDAVLQTYIVEMADVGMAQAGDGASFAIETLRGIRVG